MPLNMHSAVWEERETAETERERMSKECNCGEVKGVSATGAVLPCMGYREAAPGGMVFKVQCVERQTAFVLSIWHANGLKWNTIVFHFKPSAMLWPDLACDVYKQTK